MVDRRPVSSPVTGADTAVAVVPAPAFWARVLVPYPLVLVPYSKYQVAARPFGLTVPVSVADVPLERPVAGLVTASGAGAADVVKVPSAPCAVAGRHWSATKR